MATLGIGKRTESRIADNRPHLGGQVGADEGVHQERRVQQRVALDLRLLQRLPRHERAARGVPGMMPSVVVSCQRVAIQQGSSTLI